MNVRSFFLCSGLLVVAACSSTSSSAPAPATDAQTGDGGAGDDDAANEDAPPSDVGEDVTEPVDSAPPPDTGTPTKDTATATCNTLTDMSSGVIPVFQAGPAPTAAGGTIPPGVYVLTAVTQYGGSATTAKEFGTIDIGTSQMQRVEGSLRTTVGFEYGENQIFYTYLCGPAGVVNTNVDAKFQTGSITFTEYVPFGGGTRVRTFTKKVP